MPVICDCAVALTETFEDVEVEGSQKVTVRNGYVRPNRLETHTAFSCWKHFCPPTLLLGQVQGTLIFPWPISAASVSSYSFLFWAAPAPTLFSPPLHCLTYHPLLHQPSTLISKSVSLSLSQHSPLTCMISALKLLTCELHVALPTRFSFNPWV